MRTAVSVRDVKRKIGRLPVVRRVKRLRSRGSAAPRTPFYPHVAAPRWGYGKPPHEALRARIDIGRSNYRSVVEGILAEEKLRDIRITPGADPLEPHWDQPWFGPLDASVLYVMIRTLAPKTYLEVGSGNSTMFCKRAVSDHRLDTRIVSIDPVPRADVDSLCDEVIRSGVESVDPSVFDRLGAGDILFIDGSHQTFMNSDVTVLWMDVIPRLAPGVVVELHDVFLPYDYPPEWSSRYYSEQYLLAASLLAGNPMEILFASRFVRMDPVFSRALELHWESLGLDARMTSGGSSFWFKVPKSMDDGPLHGASSA
jgi:hypothetical protein